jgi:hypothetical protein
MTMRQRKHRQPFPRVRLDIRCPAHIAAFMNRMTEAERDAFVAKVLREYLK